jgi:hypothetical protein
VTGWLAEAGLGAVETLSLAPEKHDDRQQLTVSVWTARKPDDAAAARQPQTLERIGS